MSATISERIYETLLYLGVGILLAQSVLLVMLHTGVYSAGTADEFVVGIIFALLLIAGSVSPLLVRKVVGWST